MSLYLALSDDEKVAVLVVIPLILAVAGVLWLDNRSKNNRIDRQHPPKPARRRLENQVPIQELLDPQEPADTEATAEPATHGEPEPQELHFAEQIDSRDRYKLAAWLFAINNRGERHLASAHYIHRVPPFPQISDRVAALVGAEGMSLVSDKQGEIGGHCTLLAEDPDFWNLLRDNRRDILDLYLTTLALNGAASLSQGVEHATICILADQQDQHLSPICLSQVAHWLFLLNDDVDKLPQKPPLVGRREFTELMVQAKSFINKDSRSWFGNDIELRLACAQLATDSRYFNLLVRFAPFLNEFHSAVVDAHILDNNKIYAGTINSLMKHYRAARR